MKTCATKVLDVNEINQLVFNGKEVESMLSTSDDSVKIVSIFGKARVGKSYLMNALYNKLKNKKEFSLSAFESKKGLKGVTRGMWAILSASGHSSSSSFLLCDTEGAFEVGKHSEVSAKILALSATFSSCLILNIDKRITANELNFFNAFLSHVKLEKSNKFNELVFLVRDWTNSDEFEYGLIGGNKYLESLDDDFLKKITSMFAKTQCFLLPYIGYQQEQSREYSQYYEVENQTLHDAIGEFVRNEFDQYCNMFVEDVIIKVEKSFDCSLIKERLESAIETINNNNDISIFDLQKALDEVSLLQKQKHNELVNFQNKKKNLRKIIQDLQHESNSKDASIDNLTGKLIDVNKIRQEEFLQNREVKNSFEAKIKDLEQEAVDKERDIKNLHEEIMDVNKKRQEDFLEFREERMILNVKYESLLEEFNEQKGISQKERESLSRKIEKQENEYASEILQLRMHFEDLLEEKEMYYNKSLEEKMEEIEYIMSSTKKIANENDDLKNLCRKYEDLLENNKKNPGFWDEIGDFLKNFAREALSFVGQNIGQRFVRRLALQQ